MTWSEILAILVGGQKPVPVPVPVKNNATRY